MIMAKRIQFSATGGPEVLQYVDFTPSAPLNGEVQIENKAIGINFIDTYVRSGLYPVASLPSGLGSEAAGVVVKVGPGVSDLRVGDRVVYAQAPLGAYSEIHNVPASVVAKLPDDISFELAAAGFLKGLTVFYLFYKTHAVQAGETILFHAAAGGVGLIACQWAKALGVNLIGTVGSDEKAERAKRAGAWETINYSREDIAEKVFELTKGEKVGVVYDSVGKDTWLASLDCLKPRGLMVSFGNASGPVTDVNLGILNQKGSLFVTRPSAYGYIKTKQDLNEACETFFPFLSSGQIQVEVPASQRFPLKDAIEAHRTLASRKTVGSSLLIP